jgi:hypothetical protein
MKDVIFLTAKLLLKKMASFLENLSPVLFKDLNARSA